MEGPRDGEAWPLPSPRSPGSPRRRGLAAERVHDTPPDARPPQAQRRRVDNNVARQLQFEVEELSLDSASAAMDQDMGNKEHGSCVTDQGPSTPRSPTDREPTQGLNVPHEHHAKTTDQRARAKGQRPKGHGAKDQGSRCQRTTKTRSHGPNDATERG